MNVIVKGDLLKTLYDEKEIMKSRASLAHLCPEGIGYFFIFIPLVKDYKKPTKVVMNIMEVPAYKNINPYTMRMHRNQSCKFEPKRAQLNFFERALSSAQLFLKIRA